MPQLELTDCELGGALGRHVNQGWRSLTQGRVQSASVRKFLR